MTRRARGGLSLPEVLVAVAVLAVVTVPLMTSFLSSVGGASQDGRAVRAAVLAQELLEQVVGLHRSMGTLFPVPSESSQTTNSAVELDVEELCRRTKGEVGVSLYTGRGWRMLSRLNLSPPRDGFQRYLAITFEEVGRDRGGRLTSPALFRATARVRYTTPLSGRDLAREVKCSTLLFTEGGKPPEEFP